MPGICGRTCTGPARKRQAKTFCLRAAYHGMYEITIISEGRTGGLSVFVTALSIRKA
jgi:hypothetical protein